ALHFTSSCRCSCRLHSLHFPLHTPATTHIHTLSLHDALPISVEKIEDDFRPPFAQLRFQSMHIVRGAQARDDVHALISQLRERRSEEHTAELQSRGQLGCRLLLEKKNEKKRTQQTRTRKQESH